MNTFYDTLKKYGESEAYPFHMPGHKRQIQDFGNPFLLDITEIDGFDNLHHAEGILKEAQERAARLYEAEESFYLVNGSTCGILSAVLSCTSPGGEILMARNCHKAAYHACYLQNLKIHYLYPQTEPEFGINGGILPGDVDKLLKKNTKIQAVLLTSPTYDGAVSHVKAIAEAAHCHGIPLIVDEAHGAHFGFHSFFPESAVRLGADLVIQSLHKTLPSLTQTALLHVCGKRIDRDRLRRFLGMFQTSSPSYVLMAGMDRCVEFLEREGGQRFEKFAGRLDQFYQKMKALSHVRIPGYEIVGKYGILDFDKSKILLFPEGRQGGEWLYQILRKEYGLQLEMAAGAYCLALTSLMDTEEGFERLETALLEIDERFKREEMVSGKEAPFRDGVSRNEGVLTIREAMDGEKEEVELSESIGRISGEFLYLYPPGIPLLVPGERICENVLKQIDFFKEEGLSLQGTADYGLKKILVQKG